MDKMTLVTVESPFAARKVDGSWDAEGVEENLRYVREAMRDCLLKGEAPYASHALYTQPGVLNDQVPEERKLGMGAGFAWNECSAKSVFYLDRGWSSGMAAGLENAIRAGRPYEIRSILAKCDLTAFDAENKLRAAEIEIRTRIEDEKCLEEK